MRAAGPTFLTCTTGRSDRWLAQSFPETALGDVMVQDHPLAELLKRRCETRSIPSKRDDEARIGLVVEGGGMRGIVSAGMLIALADLGFADAFDAYFGNSAGAISAAYFLQGERWEGLSFYYSDLTSGEFINRRRVLVGKPAVDVGFVRDKILLGPRPIDLDRIERSGAQLFVAVTNVDTRHCDLISEFHSSDDLAYALAAGSWLPLLAGRPTEFRGNRCLDGGLLFRDPATVAHETGCTHVVALTTRFPRPRDRLEPWRIALRTYLNKLQAGLGEDYWDHSISTMNHRVELDALAQTSELVMNITPRAEWTAVSRLEQGLGPLLGAAREGYEATIEQMTGKPAMTVYSITSVRPPKFDATD